MLLSAGRPLLTAKLLVPPVRAEAVTRGRLTKRLDDARERKLSTVVAPAGWGKTTLLASWARQGDTIGSTGWFSPNAVTETIVGRFGDSVRFRFRLLDGRTMLNCPELDQSALRALLILLWDCGNDVISVSSGGER